MQNCFQGKNQNRGEFLLEALVKQAIQCEEQCEICPCLSSKTFNTLEI